MATLGVASLFCCGGAQAAPPSTAPVEGLRHASPEWFALEGADVVSEPGKLRRNAVVVIRDGVIVSVGEPAPRGAAVIKLARKNGKRPRIYPGLIDAYSEIETSASARRSGAGHWNALIQPQRRAADFIGDAATTHQKFRSQGVVLRLVAPSNGVIKGLSAVVTTGDETLRQSLIRDRVAQHVRLTVSRDRDEGYPNSPMGAVALARQTLLDAQWQRDASAAHRADPAIPAPESNADLDALLAVVEGRQLAFFDAPNELFFLRADLFAREHSLQAAIVGSGHEYKRLDAIRRTGRTVIVPLKFPRAPNVGTLEAAADATLAELMHWELAPENAGRLSRAGVPLALTAHGLEGPDHLLSAVRTAVKRGLSPAAALRALTTEPARLLGVDDTHGRVRPKMSASLVIVDGDLFDSETKVLETWVAGKRHLVAPAPLYTMAGRWRMQLAPAGDLPAATLRLDMQGENDKLTGRLEAPPAKPAAAEEKPAADPKARGKKAGSRASHNAAPPRAGGDAATGDKPKDNPGGKNKTQGQVQPKDKLKDNPKPEGGANDKLTDENSIALTHAGLIDARFGCDFPAARWQRTGLARLSAVLDKDGRRAWGEIVWPSGARQSVALSRRSGPPSEERPPAASEEKSAAAAAICQVNFPLGASGRPAPPEQPRAMLFTGATLWTSGPSGVIENGQLLIREGRIEAVGQDVSAPPDAVVVDLSGRHLTPGIIDCHSHMATDGGVNESTQAITAEVRIGDFIDSDDITIYRQLAGGVTVSNILHGSANPIGGQNQVIKLRWGAVPEAMKMARAPAGIKFALGENVKQSNWGDDHTSRYPQTRMGVEQLIRDALLAARKHQQLHDEWRRRPNGPRPRRDLELEALGEVLAGQRWIHCHSYRQDEILALIRTLDEFKVRIGTFQHILEGYKVADEMARHGAMGSAFADWWAYKFEVYDAIPYNGALMHRAGVVVSFNSDDRELGRRLNLEAAKAVKYGGVAPEEALKFVTLNPARQLRIDRHVGSLAPGKDADFAVWSGPPLSTFSRCEQTWIDGRKYFDRDDDMSQRSEEQKLRNAIVQKILQQGAPMLKPGEKEVDPADLWPRHDEFCHGHGHGHGHAAVHSR